MAKILVPTDDSRCSQSALKHAASLARHSDSSLVILHVVESGSTFPLVENEKAKDPLHHEFGQLLKSLSEREPPLQFEERWVEGIPVTSIIDVAIDEKADMIVMGTTGRTGIKRLIMGSVAEEVCRKAPCPVLTVKSHDSDHVQ